MTTKATLVIYDTLADIVLTNHEQLDMVKKDGRHKALLTVSRPGKTEKSIVIGASYDKTVALIEAEGFLLDALNQLKLQVNRVKAVQYEA